MNKYQFETDLLGISKAGIHLLRNRFNYETIEYSLIDEIRIERGKQVRNWLLVLIIGLCLSGLGLFIAVKIIYEFFFADNFRHFYVEEFVLPVLPIAVGFYAIYASLRSGYVLIIVKGSKRKRIPIEELNRKSEVEALKLFVLERMTKRLKFNR